MIKPSPPPRPHREPLPRNVIAGHYRRIARCFTDYYLSYSDDYVRTLAAKMVEMLRLAEDDVLVDLGGGSGIFTAALLDQVALREPVVLVDYVAEMLEQVPKDLPVEKVRADALVFAAEPRRYDKVLIKDTAHHIDDHPLLIRRIYERLEPGGALLLVHVPPDLDYPLFEAALERIRLWAADPDELESQLDAAGFETDRDAIDWRHSLPKRRYFEMVASRCLSVLSSFSDDELREGLREMERTHAGVDVLEFTDHFDYLVGYKGGRG